MMLLCEATHKNAFLLFEPFSEDAQVGVRLLRTCASYGRAFHRMRSNPAHCQPTPLQQFDSVCKQRFPAPPASPHQYEKAARTLSLAELGLHSDAVDWLAAYLVSVGGSASTSENLILPTCYSTGLGTGSHPGHRCLQQPLTPVGSGGSVELETKCPRHVVQWRFMARPVCICFAQGESFAPLRRKARSMAFLAGPEAWPFWLGWPIHMENATFVIEPRHRLGMLENTDDQWCPQCNGIGNTLFSTPLHTWPVGKNPATLIYLLLMRCGWAI